MRLRIGLAVGVAALCVVSGGRAEESKERLDRIRAEIEKREGFARDFAAKADGYLAEIEAVDRELVEIRRSRKLLAERGQAAGQELNSARGTLAVAEKDLEDARKRLAERLVVIYKFGATGGMPALYSARDFQTVVRLGEDLAHVVQGDLRTFQRFRQANQVRDRSKGEVQGLETEVADAQREIDRREQEERMKIVEKRNKVELYRDRSDRERRAAGELQDAASRLEKTMEGVPGGRVAAVGSGLVRGRVLQPVQGKIRERFGRQVDPEFGIRLERSGIEIAAERGAPVRAVGAGRVLFAGWLRGYGQVVIVDHGAATVSVSGYLEEVSVKADDSLKAGDIIGTVGETGSLHGPGLYFELRRDRKPVDPAAWFE